MTPRMLAPLVVLAHWVDAVVHLYLVAAILPAPYDKVSPLAVILISLGHLVVAIVLWTLPNKWGGAISLVFFLAAMSADLYEHFLHEAANNVFVLGFGARTAAFDASVFVLLALEIVGCLLGILLLAGRAKPAAVTA
jgi:hypothetical protein